MQLLVLLILALLVGLVYFRLGKKSISESSLTNVINDRYASSNVVLHIIKGRCHYILQNVVVIINISYTHTIQNSHCKNKWLLIFNLATVISVAE